MCEQEFEVADTVTTPNPYAQLIGRELNIGLAHGVIDYFQRIGDEFGLPAEHVMEIYLRHMAYTNYKVAIDLPRNGRRESAAAVADDGIQSSGLHSQK